MWLLMNAIEGGSYSTVHVPPVEACSNESYETMGFDPNGVKFDSPLKKVIGCFRPTESEVQQFSRSWNRRLEWRATNRILGKKELPTWCVRALHNLHSNLLASTLRVFLFVFYFS